MRRGPEDFLILVAILLLGQGIALIVVPLSIRFPEIFADLWLYFAGFAP